MELVNLKIDGISVSVPKDYTIFEAAKMLDIRIPTLCHHPALPPEGACRVCVVEVKGMRNLVASCTMPVAAGMEVLTGTKQIVHARKKIVELLISNHPRDCLACTRNGRCELQDLASDLGIRNIPYSFNKPSHLKDESNPCLRRNPDKCILCGRCIRMCSTVQSVGVYSFTNRGVRATVSPAFFQNLSQSECTYCGQCLKVCPTGALSIKSNIDDVVNALADPDKIVMVQTAPSVRVGLSEGLGGQAGDIVTGKMVAALRRLGFAKVFDTNWSADLTIMEESTELLQRIENSGVLPMMTSCCSAWVNFVELQYPDLIPHLSTAKSPQAMLGAMLKTFYAQKQNIDPEKIVSVSIMPCTAKKFEASRPELHDSGYTDVDYVLTTTELAQLVRQHTINFSTLPEEKFDDFMGEGSGAGTIFGASGGVMEAALRTAHEVVTGKQLPGLELLEVRGMEGIKEATITMGDQDFKVVVGQTLDNARKICELVRDGNPHKWSFIEIMACPGGCVNGGGQPLSLDGVIPERRQQALYKNDRQLPIRKSHENKEVLAAYDFLGEPNGHTAHELLHTSYSKQNRDS